MVKWRMLTLPANSLGVTEFPSITDFVEQWARLYVGQPPRKWLSLQQELRRLKVINAQDSDAVHEWNLAWANEHIRSNNGLNLYYTVLNIINAVRDFCYPFEHDQERVIQAWMTYFDRLPCASTAWAYAIADLYTEEIVLKYSLRLLFSQESGLVYPNRDHPALEGAMRALSQNHHTLLHQTHPNDYLAEVVINEGWWLVDTMYGQGASCAMTACNMLPWEGFQLLRQNDNAFAKSSNIDNVTF